MLAYKKNAAASLLAQKMLQEGERGLTSVATCLPNLAIAAGYWHSYMEPLRVHPCVFLLDKEERTIVDPLQASDENTTYYVAGTMGDEISGPQDLLQRLRAMGEALDTQGFSVEPINPALRSFI